MNEGRQGWRKGRKETHSSLSVLYSRIPRLCIQPSLENLFFPELVPFFLWLFGSQWSLSHSAILPIPLAIKCSSLACVHPAGEIALCQGINEHPIRAKPHQRSSRPSYFYLANKGSFLLIVPQAQGKKISSICFVVTCAAGLAYLLHFCLPCGVFPDFKNRCVYGFVQATPP